MARTKVAPERAHEVLVIDTTVATAAVQITFDDPPTERRRPKTLPNKSFQRGVEAAKIAIADGRRDLKASELVYVYAVLHEKAYSTLPMELRQDMGRASAMCSNCLRHTFGGSSEAMLDFFRWVWAREIASYKKRPPENTFRISWRYQFSQGLITDYRTFLLKTRGTTSR
jgi:hypothetical protein